MCALPGVGVGTISTSKPSGSSRVRSSSATCASLPGGLDVLARISSWSSATTSPSGPSSCALAAPGNPSATTAITASTPPHRMPGRVPGSGSMYP